MPFFLCCSKVAEHGFCRSVWECESIGENLLKTLGIVRVVLNEGKKRQSFITSESSWNLVYCSRCILLPFIRCCFEGGKSDEWHIDKLPSIEYGNTKHIKGETFHCNENEQKIWRILSSEFGQIRYFHQIFQVTESNRIDSWHCSVQIFKWFSSTTQIFISFEHN